MQKLEFPFRFIFPDSRSKYMITAFFTPDAITALYILGGALFGAVIAHLSQLEYSLCIVNYVGIAMALLFPYL